MFTAGVHYLWSSWSIPCFHVCQSLNYPLLHIHVRMKGIMRCKTKIIDLCQLIHSTACGMPSLGAAMMKGEAGQLPASFTGRSHLRSGSHLRYLQYKYGSRRPWRSGHVRVLCSPRPSPVRVLAPVPLNHYNDHYTVYTV